jgi:hypothetical protein
MAGVGDVWVRYPWGGTPTVNPVADQRMRIVDPRKPEWQSRFLDACAITLASDRYAGLYLDQCTVFSSAVPMPGERAEMIDALNSVLARLRARMPDVLLVANSSLSFPALNGELNENRPDDLAAEQFGSHQAPEASLFQYLQPEPDASASQPQLREMARAAFANRCYFAVTDNYQRVHWPACLDELAAARSEGASA